MRLDFESRSRGLSAIHRMGMTEAGPPATTWGQSIRPQLFRIRRAFARRESRDAPEFTAEGARTGRLQASLPGDPDRGVVRKAGRSPARSGQKLEKPLSSSMSRSRAIWI